MKAVEWLFSAERLPCATGLPGVSAEKQPDWLDSDLKLLAVGPCISTGTTATSGISGISRLRPQ
jgi:hypothetical protein